jgi:endogenous inhibitor of DNA gyrase (YacG/DUF329 family)
MTAEPREEVCVFCRLHPVDPRWRPFCSQRCQVQDLARWADGTYRVPGPAADAPEDETKPDEHS